MSGDIPKALELYKKARLHAPDDAEVYMAIKCLENKLC